MARQRFDTAPEFRVADDSVVIQQVAGSSAPLLELKDHSGSALVTVHSTGQMTTTVAPSFVSPSLTGTPTAPTASAGTNTTQIATTAFVRTELSNLVDAAPTTLDTLNELAAALGDDANFSTTVTTALGLKAPLANPTFTGTVTAGTISASSLTTSSSSFDLVNTFALTVNLASAATSINIGSTTGSTTIRNDLTLVGNVSKQGVITTSGGIHGNLYITANNISGAGNQTAPYISIAGASATGTGVVSGGPVALYGGQASGGTTNTGGNANIDGGYGSTSSGAVYVGAAYASAVYIGNSSITTAVTGNLTVSGNLTVNGTTTTINSTTLSVDDINITLGDTASPTDVTANGGGITLKGATDKTITWTSTSGGWEFSHPGVFTTIPAQGRAIGVRGSASGSDAILQFTNNAISAQWGSITATSGGKLVLSSQTDGVGIGGTPTYPLHVQSSNYMIAAFQSSGGETKIDLINTSTNGRTYSIISGGASGSFAGGIFGIWDSTASQVRIGINASGDIRLNGGLQMGSRSRTQNQTGGLGQVFGSVFSDEFATTNRVAYFGGTSGVSTWYGTTTKVFAAIDGNGSEGLSFWSNDSAGTWANIINYGASSITFNRVLSIATWRGSIDRAWDNYPSITIANTTDLGPQGEFRIHGYPGGSGGDYSINLRIDGSYLNLSDARIKTNVTPITGALDLVGNLNGVRYQKMNRSLEPETHTNINNGVKFGLIAQDSIEFIPECIAQTPNATPLENGWCDEYAMDYAQLTPLLIEAIKELTARVQQLEAAA